MARNGILRSRLGRQGLVLVAAAGFCAVLALCFAGPLRAAAGAEQPPSRTLTLKEATETVTLDELKAHLTYIASDELKGRDSGTEGCRKAAEYIVKELASYGITPFGEMLEPGDKGEGQGEWQGKRSYLQKLPVPGSVNLAKEENLLELTADGKATACELGKQFLPLFLSANAGIKDKEIAFVGYGITDKESGYDDYAGIDVKGKVVVVLRYGHQEPPAGMRELAVLTSVATKVRNAIDHGTAGMIFVNGPLHNQPGEDDPFVKLQDKAGFENKDMPAVHAKQAVVEQLLGGSGDKLTELQKELNETKKPAPFVIKDKTVSLAVRIEPPTSSNVIGLIEGTDEKLKNEYIVVGAHYDHVGLGLYGGRWGERGKGKIHNGANDNGSGVAALIEVAEAAALLKERPKRSILLVFFTAEERGEVGSKYFVAHPPVPLTSIKAMINLDMIGRAVGGRIVIAGGGTCPVLPGIIAAQNADLKIRIQIGESGQMMGDSGAFLVKRIPILFYWSGYDNEYHSPADKVELINFPDLTRITKHILLTAVTLADCGQPIEYFHVESQRHAQLGFILALERAPDVVVGFIGKGCPAERGGLRWGDTIVEVAGEKVRDVAHFRELMSKQKSGSAIKLKVNRGGKELELSVK